MIRKMIERPTEGFGGFTGYAAMGAAHPRLFLNLLLMPMTYILIRYRDKTQERAVPLNVQSVIAPSIHPHAATHIDGLTGNIFRQIRAEKQRHIADVVASLKASQRNGFSYPLF